MKAAAPYRPFTADSWWNTPISTGRVPNSDAIIRWIAASLTVPTNNWIMVGPSDPAKCTPVYWPSSSDPLYDVRHPDGSPFPMPEAGHLRIPAKAQPSPTSDAQFVLIDRPSGWTAELWKARYDGSKWTAEGFAVYYLASNGLAWGMPGATDRRNRGHRGLPPSCKVLRRDFVSAGKVPHVLDLFVPQTKASHVFPYVGDEAGTSAADAPPEGARLRLRTSVDLSKLSPEAKVIATGLRDYGAVIGDRTGGNAITLQRELAPWPSSTHDCLSGIKLTPQNFEIVDPGIKP